MYFLLFCHKDSNIRFKKDFFGWKLVGDKSMSSLMQTSGLSAKTDFESLIST